MNLFLERIQSGSHKNLKCLLDLYVIAFPPEERRNTSDLTRMLNNPDMYFSAILVDEVVVGFVVFWKFNGFLYIEHLAIYPCHRKKGIGRVVLKQLQKEGNPILLEVEIPFDEASNLRVNFYQGSGFSSLPVYYNQPPYRKGESLVPMFLFSDKSDWEAEILRSSIDFFQDRVYLQNNKN
ncbi:MAG: GNAT family N-acetyltransferase [Prolixibacteraceae bacterium]